MNKKYKFIIVSPRQHSGGAIVLHLLCKLLQNRGYDAKIFYTMTPISYYETKKKKNKVQVKYKCYQVGR